MKRCLIVTGGTLETEFLKSYLQGKDFSLIAAVDGALAGIEALGLFPTHAVGDFDTASPELVRRFEALPGITWERHRPEKDETDTELALDLMLEEGAESITIVGALGTRMDHTFANIGLLYRAHQAGVPCEIIDSRNRITLVEKTAHFRKETLWGKYVSFYPFGGDSKRLTLQGFKYPTQDLDVGMGQGRCISNELEAEDGHLTLGEGLLLCFETKD